MNASGGLGLSCVQPASSGKTVLAAGGKHVMEEGFHAGKSRSSELRTGTSHVNPELRITPVTHMSGFMRHGPGR
jgi:hypothetical protein